MLFKFTFDILLIRGAKILSKITNIGFHGKPLIFFYFCDLVFIDYCLKFWVVFTKMVAEKIETLVVFMEGKKS